MERVQLGPYQTSWHGREKLYLGMPLERYVREKYIPAPGYNFVDKDGSVYHLPIDQEIQSGS